MIQHLFISVTGIFFSSIFEILIYAYHLMAKLPFRMPRTLAQLAFIGCLRIIFWHFIFGRPLIFTPCVKSVPHGIVCPSRVSLWAAWWTLSFQDTLAFFWWLFASLTLLRQRLVLYRLMPLQMTRRGLISRKATGPEKFTYFVSRLMLLGLKTLISSVISSAAHARPSLSPIVLLAVTIIGTCLSSSATIDWRSTGLSSLAYDTYDTLAHSRRPPPSTDLEHSYASFTICLLSFVFIFLF